MAFLVKVKQLRNCPWEKSRQEMLTCEVTQSWLSGDSLMSDTFWHYSLIFELRYNWLYLTNLFNLGVSFTNSRLLCDFYIHGPLSLTFIPKHMSFFCQEQFSKFSPTLLKHWATSKSRRSILSVSPFNFNYSSQFHFLSLPKDSISSNFLCGYF